MWHVDRANNRLEEKRSVKKDETYLGKMVYVFLHSIKAHP
jgi:hypothetical protein